jgi:UDPglucose 6-dehydrogenase
MEALWQAGANVQAYDPVAMDEAHRIYGERADLKLVEDKYDALDRAEALIVCTEWQQFRAPDFEEMQRRLTRKVVIDGRNLYSPARMKADGWSYYSVGRTASDGG